MRPRNLILLLLAAGLASAAAIDGTWTSEMKMRAGKKAGGQDRTVPLTLNLKAADDGTITGTVVTSGKKRGQTAQIQSGKLDGNKFSFVTVRTTKKGEQKMEWRGSLDNDTLQGTCARENGKRRRGQSFTAKRG